MQFLRDRRVLIGGAVALVGILGIAALVFALRAESEPEICNITWMGGSMEVPCDRLRNDDAPAAASSSSEPWWAGDVAQAVYAFIGFGIPAAGGGWAYWRHRERRKRLAEAMRRVDELATTTKARPAEGARALAALRVEMRADFHSGRMDDGHFLELDKRATNAILKLRMLELDQRFPSLPPGLRNQVVTLVGDGNVSDAEVQLLRASLATQLIPGRVRDELLLMLDSWARQDSGEPAEDEPRAAPADAVLVQLQEP